MKTHVVAKDQPKNSRSDSQAFSNDSYNGRWHRIAEKAYELYEARGQVPGKDLEDWLKAEALVDGRTA